jgi:hypothetical protein
METKPNQLSGLTSRRGAYNQGHLEAWNEIDTLTECF